jgi:hypothetical protein
MGPVPADWIVAENCVLRKSWCGNRRPASAPNRSRTATSTMGDHRGSPLQPDRAPQRIVSSPQLRMSRNLCDRANDRCRGRPPCLPVEHPSPQDGSASRPLRLTASRNHCYGDRGLCRTVSRRLRFRQLWTYVPQPAVALGARGPIHAAKLTVNARDLRPITNPLRSERPYDQTHRTIENAS